LATIDPKGLFYGDRLAACTDAAQNWWPRLFLASNGYGRIELNYPNIVGKCFAGYRKKPTEKQLWDVFADLAKNFLVVLYESDEVWWAQFITSERHLPNYKTREDEMSPAPHASLMEAARAGHILVKKNKSHRINLSEKFRNSSEDFPLGVGVGEGVGEELIAPSKLDAEAPPQKIFIELPTLQQPFAVSDRDLDSWSELYPAVDVRQAVRNMRGWLESSPRKRKSHQGMSRFVHSWLRGDQDKGRTPAKAASPQLRSVTLEEAMQR
jgi:hypothetical protein